MSAADLVVSLFGTVHVTGCSEIPGLTWAWVGRNHLNGDAPCPVCLPGGLPERPPHQFSETELAQFRGILSDGSPA